jgi:hypothetical protein
MMRVNKATTSGNGGAFGFFLIKKSEKANEDITTFFTIAKKKFSTTNGENEWSKATNERPC